jgi:hypothetical protein
MNRMKKIQSSKGTSDRKNFASLRRKHETIARTIPLEVDLENREVFLGNDVKEQLDLKFETNNVDSLISTYVHPDDSKRVILSLKQAKEGQEKPIHFSFVHPSTARRLHFEFRYEIVYVRYSSTRLHGVLVNVSKPKEERSSARG